jgi:hypothetical protein
MLALPALSKQDANRMTEHIAKQQDWNASINTSRRKGA